MWTAWRRTCFVLFLARAPLPPAHTFPSVILVALLWREGWTSPGMAWTDGYATNNRLFTRQLALFCSFSLRCWVGCHACAAWAFLLVNRREHEHYPMLPSGICCMTHLLPISSSPCSACFYPPSCPSPFAVVGAASPFSEPLFWRVFLWLCAFCLLTLSYNIKLARAYFSPPLLHYLYSEHSHVFVYLPRRHRHKPTTTTRLVGADILRCKDRPSLLWFKLQCRNDIPRTAAAAEEVTPAGIHSGMVENPTYLAVV